MGYNSVLVSITQGTPGETHSFRLPFKNLGTFPNLLACPTPTTCYATGQAKAGVGDNQVDLDLPITEFGADRLS